jgi:transposase
MQEHIILAIMTRHSLRESRTANAVLNEAEVRVIRRNLAAGSSARLIAELYGLSIETIRRIGRRDTWAWVKDEAELDAPLPPASEEEKAKIAESLARVQRRLAQDPPPAGESALAKMQKTLKERNPNNLLAELSEGARERAKILLGEDFDGTNDTKQD